MLMLIQFLGSLRCMDVGNAAYILKVHATSIFRIKLCRVGAFLNNIGLS
jgi:hypothetical protein